MCCRDNTEILLLKKEVNLYFYYLILISFNSKILIN